MSSSHHHETPSTSIGGVARLLIVIALALLASLLWNTCGNPLGHHGKEHGKGHGEAHGSAGSENKHGEEHTAHTAPMGKLDAVSGDFIYETGKMVTLELPNNGGKLEVGEYSTENKLVQFLNDKAAAIDTVKGNWFELTNVRFKTGGTVIDSSSMVQLKNIAAICKAFPAAQFKVGGYTDNSGDTAANVTLSQKRADAVLAELKKLGVSAAAFTGAKGYGPEHPVGDNTTAEGKAMNRRVAVNVKAK